MKILGIDFTSAPNGRKPITVAYGELSNAVLHIESVRGLTRFKQFEDELDAPGPWIAGIDFPFGQPVRLIHALHWPASWSAYVGKIGSMKQDEYESTIKRYCARRPYGDKEHKRITDEYAGSISPMKLGRPPVGKMFFQGAPRILRSGACILPCAPNDDDRVIVEAYPALVAENLVGNRHYKGDGNAGDTPTRRATRAAIVSALSTEQCRASYWHNVKITQEERKRLIEDAGADFLDAVLCAVQAAWSSSQSDYGVSDSCDPDEGWIVDPSQLDKVAFPAHL